jgi:methylmalonyl-CoA mutase
MSESSIHSILNEAFPNSGKEEWLRVASQELGKQNQIENLIWKIGELNFYPYYEEKDLHNLAYIKKYPIPSEEKSGFENLPKMRVAVEKHANERALESLALGANGVLFDVTERIDFDINHLLERITWPYCTVSFLSAPETKIVTKILAYAEQSNYTHSALRGSIFWQALPEAIEVKPLLSSSLNNFHALGIAIPSSEPVQEISKSLEQGVKLIDTLTDHGAEKEAVFKNISLSFNADENFLINIAKLKAVRLLWYQLSQAFGIRHYSPDNLYIHVQAARSPSMNFEPQGHMIKNTTDGLSAVLGGCDALTLFADDQDEMTQRIALHVANILKEESHLDQVTNAVAGAYAIESMINELAQSAWNDFQKKMMP